VHVEEYETDFDINIGTYEVYLGHYHECEECNETWEHHEEKDEIS